MATQKYRLLPIFYAIRKLGGKLRRRMNENGLSGRHIPSLLVGARAEVAALKAAR
jgi:hypothetical protein